MGKGGRREGGKGGREGGMQVGRDEGWRGGGGGRGREKIQLSTQPLRVHKVVFYLTSICLCKLAATSS